MKKLEEYTSGAEKYDSEHQDKCHKWEALEIKRVHLKGIKGKELLDVGCGTGIHLQYLKDDFNCTGIDFHQEMINVARKKLGNKVKLLQGDMATFNLHKQFDAIISLYSVINYAGDYRTFRKIIMNFYNHLKKGGVAIIEPDYTVNVYKNFTGKSRRASYMIMNDISKWSRIMREEGFKVKYFYKGLHGSAKGLYVLRK
jgi:ubiquinone/menaquinone biosynthesis C-methylase UbiE